tara:strand:+ start:255 stop:647 length:393 start_codon:yes stop_codon:yes gene_type:complete
MTDRLKKYNLAKDLALVKDDEMEKEAFHTKLDMQIQNLISPDNIGDTASVKVFQQLMNKHIYGEDKLKVDGKWGKESNQALLDYRWNRKHWFSKNENWDVDARRTAKLYQQRKDIQEERKRHTNPGGLLY